MGFESETFCQVAIEWRKQRDKQERMLEAAVRRMDEPLRPARSGAQDDGCPPPLPDEAYAKDPRMEEARDASPPTEAPKDRVSSLLDSLIPAEDISAITDRPYLIKGWLDRGALSVIYGESNVGKTFLALDLGFHIAAGKAWHGHRTGPAGRVIYVAAEGGGGIRNRIEAIRREHPDMVKATAGRFQLLPAALDLHGESDAAALIEVAKRGDPVSLIVIDTLARAMGEGDENTAKDMGMLIASVDRIRAETGAHVMLIHHSGKDTTKGARGSGSLRGAADTEIEITRDGEVIMAETRKQRDMAFSAPFAYALHGVFLGSDQDGDPVTSCVVAPLEGPPPPKQPKISGQAKIALQAFGDALAHHGEVRSGDMFPPGQQCVSLERWREFCDRHSLSDGDNPTSHRTAFHKAKKTLQEKGLIRIVDGYAWRTED